MSPPSQDVLVAEMQRPSFYPHATAPQIALLQTHISFIFLTGTYAYKVKKAVTFDFLDYGTLAQRKHFCEEELRLNGRGAPDIYLEVLPITVDRGHFAMNGRGEVAEYAIKMRQFPQECLVSNLLAQGKVDATLAERLGQVIAHYHEASPANDPAGNFGDVEHVARLLSDNIAELRKATGDCPSAGQLDQIEHFARQFVNGHAPAIAARASGGFIRQCHGDLHLRNICLWEARLQLFDCIEFNDYLRHVDVMYDIAFAVMDFDAVRRHDLRVCFLNAYLERTGDWEGLHLLPYYLCRQALVRGKVQRLLGDELPQGSDEASRAYATARHYFELSADYARPRVGCMVIFCGVSGSGKSTVARLVAGETGAIHIRSDAVRKHLAGIPPEQRGTAEIYRDEMTQATYSRLGELGTGLAREGYAVILDATFARREPRRRVIEQAKAMNIPLHIVHCAASPDVLHRRLSERRGDISDATASILTAQLSQFDPLLPEELLLSTTIDTAATLDVSAVVRWVKSHASA